MTAGTARTRAAFQVCRAATAVITSAPLATTETGGVPHLMVLVLGTDTYLISVLVPSATITIYVAVCLSAASKTRSDFIFTKTLSSV